jgi:hypothetical protein
VRSSRHVTASAPYARGNPILPPTSIQRTWCSETMKGRRRKVGRRKPSVCTSSIAFSRLSQHRSRSPRASAHGSGRATSRQRRACVIQPPDPAGASRRGEALVDDFQCDWRPHQGLAPGVRLLAASIALHREYARLAVELRGHVLADVFERTAICPSRALRFVAIVGAAARARRLGCRATSRLVDPAKRIP